MKKILSILATITLTSTTSSLVVACTDTVSSLKTIDLDDTKREFNIDQFGRKEIKITNRSKLTGLKITTSGNITATLGGKNNDVITVEAGKFEDSTKDKTTLKIEAKNAYTEVISFSINQNSGWKEIETDPKEELELKQNEEQVITIKNYSELKNVLVSIDSTEHVTYKHEGNKIRVYRKSEGEAKLTIKADNVDNSKESKTINIK
ncbi:lipoprotein [Spiroplasma endosymbiont of Diplazon laetatorius]|uniref:lipoprotein n=1 Tax=Spiroplasma endosymbiont of Diplazon laetatorius TaxID=3066322 RepID=UPI0030D150D7